MAANIPMKLRSADITRFQQRAAQLEKLKPAVAYWCYYWIVKQILSRDLHTADDECRVYTTDLVDKLEHVGTKILKLWHRQHSLTADKMKVQYASDNAVVDDVAGQAYVEQFGMETFQRADNAVRANKASRQTAETFQAAATFLDLAQIWGPPSPEISSKIKYAKYHALRIAKAIKAGEDPNLTNPVMDSPPSPGEPMELDPNDPEVQRINGIERQPSIEEVPDEGDRLQARLARQSSIDQSLHPSRASSMPRQSPVDSSNVSGAYSPEVSPLAESNNIPTFHHMSPASGLAPHDVPPNEPQTYYTELPSTPSAPADPDPSTPFQPPLRSPEPHHSPPPPRFPHQQSRQSQAAPQQPKQAMGTSTQSMQDLSNDDAAVIDAQKHAKWAISALNFEDVSTAVKELRLALKALGAQ